MAAEGSVNPNGVFVEDLRGDSATRFMRSQQNQLATGGAQNTVGGQNTYGAGLGALGPVLAQLTGLVKGDSADVNQQIQPEANRIKDSFAAARSMISSQARGGGKAGVLAEAPFKQAQQIGDIGAQAKAGATGQLGQLATTLAGLGQGQEQLGLQGTEAASSANLQRRQQDQADSFVNNFSKVAGAVGGLTTGVGALY